ncbi:hypothetical protein ASPCAL13786 [Aspergillus calidoustus]|uniref:Uncharacterized protein n=1 Tax=Aspergillus calidoustus TaxID=454130 RepID=A0A0U5GIM9_ASPCI|nr:hypothetical protein ASPCAL13786 [Aspergillus calidoustus]
MGDHFTQRLSIIVKNNIHLGGDITVRNTLVARGEPYKKGQKPTLIAPEDVNKLVISHGEEGTVSFCGSAVYRSGVKGSLDLYDGDTRIASLHWRGPWALTGNYFEVTDVKRDISVIVTNIAP